MANALSVPDTSSSGGTSATAIVGDNPSPYGAALLGTTTTDALTTGDLSAGDAGEMGGLSEFAVEVWYLGGSTGVDNIILRGPRSSTVGADQWSITMKAAGNLSAAVIDGGGVVRSNLSTTVIQSGLFYHVVLTGQGGSLNLYINGVLEDANATWSGRTVQTIGAVVGSEDLQVVGPTVGGFAFYFDELAVYRTGLTAARVLEHYNAGVNRGFARQAPGQRITAILDAASSHAPRSIQAGTRNVVPRYMSGQAPLEEIRNAVEAEDVDAAFFVSASGTLIFLADGHRSSSPYNTIQATFGDGAGELAYLDLKVDYSESFLINEWNVTRSSYGPTSASTQTVSDATSISRYFKRSQSLSDVPVTTDADSLTIATALLAKYKDPMQRITSVSFNTLDKDITEALLRRELMDKVRIIRTPPGGGSRITQDVFIQKIDIQGANDGGPWSITWGVSPL